MISLTEGFAIGKEIIEFLLGAFERNSDTQGLALDRMKGTRIVIGIRQTKTLKCINGLKCLLSISPGLIPRLTYVSSFYNAVPPSLLYLMSNPDFSTIDGLSRIKLKFSSVFIIKLSLVLTVSFSIRANIITRVGLGPKNLPVELSNKQPILYFFQYSKDGFKRTYM